MRSLTCFWLIVSLLLIPPASFAAQEGCGNAPAPHLQSGMLVTVTPGQSNNVRDTPTSNGTRIGQLLPGTEATVLDGPKCADGYNWYQIEVGDMVGWTVEGSDGEYWLVEVGSPITLDNSGQQTQGDVACAEPHLYPGGQGIVNIDEVLRVRHTPSTTGEQVGEIFGGTVFDVEDGFQCSEGYLWWLVQLGGIEGWMVEGNVSNYFVEPFTSSTQSVTANSLDWSPESTRLAVGTNVGGWVFDVTDLDRPPRRAGSSGNSIAFRPDGMLVVALPLLENREYGFSFYDPSTGELLERAITGWEGEIDPPPDPSFRAVVYAAESDRRAIIQGRWAFVELDSVNTIFLSQISEGSQTIGIDLLPQGTQALVLYATDEGGRVGIHALRNPAINEELLTPIDSDLDVSSMALSADGERFAIGSTDGQLQQWSFIGRTLTSEVSIGGTPVQRLAYTSDGTALAVASNNTLSILNAEDLETVSQMDIGSPAIDMAYAPDSSLLAVVTSRQLWIFDSEEYETVNTFSLE